MSQSVAQIVQDVSLDMDVDFYQDVIDGFSKSNKSLSPKYFYDELGSQYFDEICQLEEYYPCETELTLLPKVLADIANHFVAPVSVVEFGAGSLVKIQPLLDNIQTVSEFIPIDISGEHLHQACQQLRQTYPQVNILPTVGDFTHVVELAAFSGQRLGFFPGSTIGNFTPEQAQHFLASAKQTLGDGSYMLIGVDTKKSPEILHAAYNDAKGVTAKFNLNVLERINREFDANINVNNFEHYAFYNVPLGRIEMHLISKIPQTISICDALFSLRSGESIHTESSYKYTPEDFTQLANKAGWKLEKTWLAEDDMFAMYLLKSEGK